jgi:hypothetical protein
MLYGILLKTFSWIEDSVAKNISYWSTANGDDTMITLWNPADEEF